jgi:hypothetical protein
MGNIKLTYLYRDAGNYKTWRSVVFDNPRRLALEEVKNYLATHFLPERTFVANQIGLPESFFEDTSNDDHCLHELHSVESTNDEPTDALNRGIHEFLCDVKTAADDGWSGFSIDIAGMRIPFKFERSL